MSDQQIRERFQDALNLTEAEYGSIKGIADNQARLVLIKQFLDSYKRVNYFNRITDLSYAGNVLERDGFNPLKAVIYYKDNGHLDEAIWLTLLATHFGKHHNSGWGLLINFYFGLDKQRPWLTFNRLITEYDNIMAWIQESRYEIKADNKFSNHRKYISIKNLEKLINTFIRWTDSNPYDKFYSYTSNSTSSTASFNQLYRNVNIYNFNSRLGKFDFLCNLGKLKLLEIEPDSIYFENSTGPKSGLKEFYEDEFNSRAINEEMNFLNQEINFPFGMQIIEDAICNWQKNKRSYTRYR